MRKTVLTLLLASFVGMLAFAQQKQQIERLYDYEKYQEARSVAVDWVTKEPTNPEAWYVAGKLLSKLNMVDSAETFFKKGIEVSPKTPSYNYIGLLRIAFHKNVTDKDKLEDLFDKAKDFRTSKKDQRWFLEMADACLLAPVENNQIENYLNDAIKLERKNAQIYMIWGEFFSLQNNVTAANEKYQIALDYDKTLSRAYVEKGSVYEKVKNYGEAEIQYKKAIEMDSLFPPAHGNLAEMYHSLKQYQKAVDEFGKYMKYGEPSVANERRYASYLFQAKDYKTAISTLEKLYAKDAKDPYYVRLLAWSYTEIGDSVKSVKYFDDYFSLVDKTKGTYGDYSRYGRALIKAGKDTLLALENLKMAYALDTTKVEVLSEMSKVYKKLKRWKDVAACMDMKIKNGGNAVETTDYLDLGMSYYFDSLYQKSRETLEKLVSIKPKLFIGYLWLSRSLVALDPESKDGLAKPAYEKIIELCKEPDRYKNDLITANAYLGSYYYIQAEVSRTANDKAKEDEQMVKCISYWKKIQEIDPTNAQLNSLLTNKVFKEYFSK
ncbi:MAG: tetratricopeptide repeat protein [Ignavibacteria bacterium]|nr:tetratricopeptide repeat protein [Ignavibacteria bacterium]